MTDSGVSRDEGSVLPLIIGFWLVAMLFVAGSLALGSAFTDQRALQATCDSAALAAANGISSDRLHDAGGTGAADLPLGNARAALDAYLARDRSRHDVVIDPPLLDPDGVTIRLTCHRHSTVTFQTLIAHPHGIEQNAASIARTPLD